MALGIAPDTFTLGRFGYSDGNTRKQGWLSRLDSENPCTGVRGSIWLMPLDGVVCQGSSVGEPGVATTRGAQHARMISLTE
jgi:hypothetical protein